MNDSASTVVDAGSLSNTENEDKELKKQLKLEKERKDLLESLASGDFSTTKARVASVLNLFPNTRNSDVALALKYWETFQPEIYSANGILPKDLFRLERFHYLVRARAKIQNQYGLFEADDKIRRHRKVREETMHDAVLESGTARRVVKVFSDETGKTSEFVCVASVWVLAGLFDFKVTRAIQEWKDKSAWTNREVHFAKFGKNDINPLNEYLDVIAANREYLSFKVIAVERAKTKRSIEEIVEKLHEHMLIRGVEHELFTKRIDLPREIEMAVDEEHSLDQFVLAEMSRRISQEFERTYEGQVSITEIKAASSRHSPMIQLADLIAGATNRKLNHRGERGYKDDMADLVFEKLGLGASDEAIADLDASAFFVV